MLDNWSRADKLKLLAIIVTIIIAVPSIWLILDPYESPDFSVSVDPMQGVITSGGVIQTTLTIKGVGDYKHDVSLSAIGQPPGMALSFVPPIGGPKPSYTSMLIINVAQTVPESDYPITIKGLGNDGTEHTCIYTLTVTKLDFDILASAGLGGTISPSGTIHAKQGESYTFYIIPESGYQILDVKLDGVSQGNNSTYILSQIQEKHEISATFSKITPSINITYPLNGSNVDPQITVEGTSNYIPTDQVIWIVVYVPKVSLYYPMTTPVNMQQDGSWSSFTTLGGPEDTGDRFDIIAIGANQMAQNEINIYISNATSSPDGIYPGIASLPVGTKEYSRVIVTRGDW